MVVDSINKSVLECLPIWNQYCSTFQECFCIVYVYMSPCIFDKGPRCHGLDLVVGLADSVVDVTDRLAE